ncbi:MAG: SCO1664 family protein [Acidimicrobiales bacterium]
MPENERPSPADALTVLRDGEVEIEGRMPWSSNRTFLVACRLGDDEMRAVYKPGRGERPLWDFPSDIYRREVAASELSQALGWDLVPLTIERDDAPFGPGSLQRFVPADFSQHHFTLVEDEANHDRLRAICAFDIVANNADRKSGHCLLGDDGSIWAIDNGLCFHCEDKLRTVIWEFAGERVPDHLLDDLDRLGRAGTDRFDDLLAPPEIEALYRRMLLLVSQGCFPVPDPDSYHYPWPPV